MKMILDEDGKIIAFGVQAWPGSIDAPDFVTFQNMSLLTCTNQSDVSNPASWTQAPIPDQTEIELP